MNEPSKAEFPKEASPRRPSPVARGMGWLLGALLPLAVLIVGALGAARMMQTPPQAERGRGGPGETARLVETETIRRGEERITVEVMGTVKPARSVVVQPQVGGRIEWVNPDLVPGGVLDAGEELLRIESRDYELAVRQREVAVLQAESDLEIEMGEQEIARQDFELLGEEIPEDEQGLVLREPQLEKAKADLEAAKVALEAARLDLSRTRLRAPFESIVVSESAELGAVANPSTGLAELVGTDQYWIELAVPVDELRWIELPGPDRERGSEVHVSDEAAWPAGQYRTGYVIRYRGDVDEESRMATLVVAVDDPLARDATAGDRPRLLLNSYVRARVQGRMLPDAASIARANLHQGDTIWVMDAEGKLDIRQVSVEWRGRDRVLIREGIQDGERLVTTRLSAPVAGMNLRTLGDAEAGNASPSGMEPLGADAPAPETPGGSDGPQEEARHE